MLAAIPRKTRQAIVWIWAEPTRFPIALGNRCPMERSLSADFRLWWLKLQRLAGDLHADERLVDRCYLSAWIPPVVYFTALSKTARPLAVRRYF